MSEKTSMKKKLEKLSEYKAVKVLKKWELRRRFQTLGNVLSGMIMPIIGVIIAWGLITAFFIPTGWTPVSAIDKYVVGPSITYLIPALIGFMGGYNIYKLRGGFFGALAAFLMVGGATAFADGSLYGDIIGFGAKTPGAPITELGPQFLGAMIVGPTAALVLKHTEKYWDGKIKAGFEMLVNNFYFAILGVLVGLFTFYVMLFPIWSVTYIFGEIVGGLTRAEALPVASLFVEPAKPLFLNNAINHGVFTPLGVQQTQEAGKSLLYYIESNPGPGMGMLLGIMLFDKDPKQRAQASGASVVHFFGGIHEVYFPFILVRPLLILSTMAGGLVGTSMLQIFNAGAVAPASPGSIIALFAVSANSGLNYAGLALAIFGGLLASLIVTFFLLKLVYNKRVQGDSVGLGNELLEKLKGKKSKYVDAITQKEPALNMNGNVAGGTQQVPPTPTTPPTRSGNLLSVARTAKNVVFACDAGMGSSALGASILRKEVKGRDINGVKVTNTSLSSIPGETDIIVTQNTLADRARSQNPGVYVYEIDQFLMKEEYTELLDALQNNGTPQTNAPATPQQQKPTSSNKPVKQLFQVSEEQVSSMEQLFHICCDPLVNKGIVTKDYFSSVVERSKLASFYMGNGLIIPHSTEDGRKEINGEGALLTTWLKKPIMYDGNIVHFAITIAVNGENHMDALQKIATLFMDQNKIDELVSSQSEHKIQSYLTYE